MGGVVKRIGIPAGSVAGLLCRVFGGVVLMTASIGAAEWGDGTRFGTERLTFNIPAQPLELALDAYSAATGNEIFYDGALVAGLRSTVVTGRLSPDAALETLLRGTGLVPRFTGTSRFSLTLPRLAALRSSLNDGAFRPYFASVQAALRRAFCDDVLTRPADYAAVIRLWIAPSGALSRAALVEFDRECRPRPRVRGGAAGGAGW